MCKMKLYEINELFSMALDNLLYNDDIDDVTRFDTLGALELQMQDKGRSVCAYILNTDSQIDMLKEHVKKMQAKLRTLERANDGLRDYLKRNMLASGITEIKAIDGTFAARIGKGRESIVVDDESKLPDYCFVVERRVSKTAIREALDSGDAIIGAHIERTPTLTIR